MSLAKEATPEQPELSESTSTTAADAKFGGTEPARPESSTSQDGSGGASKPLQRTTAHNSYTLKALNSLRSQTVDELRGQIARDIRCFRKSDRRKDSRDSGVSGDYRPYGKAAGKLEFSLARAALSPATTRLRNSDSSEGRC